MPFHYAIRWILFSTFIATLCLGTLGIGMDIMYHFHLKPQVETWKAKKTRTLPLFQTEMTHFRSHPLFSEALKTEKNDGKEYNLIDDIPNFWRQGLAISQNEKHRVLSLKDQWIERRFKLPKKSVEPFFDRIGNYTYFQLQPEDLRSPSVFPFDFVALSQIYLASTTESDPPAQDLALARVKRLARLLLRSSHHEFQLSGLSIIEKGKDFLAYRHRRTPAMNTTATQKSTPNFETLNSARYRHFLYTTYEYLDFLMDPQLVTSVFLQAEPWPPGFCSIIERKYSDLSFMATPLDGRLVGEPAFTEELATIASVKKRFRTHCTRALIDTRNGQSMEPIKFSWTKHIPFLRRIVAYNYLLKHKSMARIQ